MGFNRPKNWRETNIYYIIPFFSCLTTTMAVAILQNFANIVSLKNALILGVTIGIGFGMTITFTNATIPIMKKPLVFGIITGSAHTIGITLASIIVYAI